MGRSGAEIEATEDNRRHQWMKTWVHTASPGGESFDELSSRVRGWLENERTDGAESTILVAAHAGPVRALLCHALDLPLDHAFRIEIDGGGVSTMAHGPTGWTIS